MWGDQDRLEEIKTPKYLKEETCSRGDPLRYRGGKEEKKDEGLKEINIYLVLEVLTVRWWEEIQEEIELISD